MRDSESRPIEKYFYGSPETRLGLVFRLQKMDALHEMVDSTVEQ